MNGDRYTFDTNILFYALDENAGAKHHIASQLIASGSYERVVLVLQSLAELCNAIRKKMPRSVSLADEFIRENILLFDVVHAMPSDLNDAILAHQEHRLPFWDAMLWATARRARCNVILSEDFQDGQVLGGVTIRNPFAPGFNLDAL